MFIQESALLEHLSWPYPVIAAIDEVGRGCVAGPVVVCVSLWVCRAFLNTQSHTKSIPPILQKSQSWLSLIGDSKGMSATQRLKCKKLIDAEYLRSMDFSSFESSSQGQGSSCGSDISLPVLGTLVPSHNSLFVSHAALDKASSRLSQKQKTAHFECIDFHVASCTAQEVDALNIWEAVQRAASRALQVLHTHHPLFLNSNALIVMDGKLPTKVPQILAACPQAMIIKADERLTSVGFSSVVAKVERDLYMEHVHQKFPQYGFKSHKGYGTKAHFLNIQSTGLSPLHRKTFLKNLSVDTQTSL